MSTWGAWSAWAYDEANQAYRVRQNLEGNLQYEYFGETPRETGSVAGITESLDRTNLSSPSSSYEQQSPSSPENYVVASHKEKDKSSKSSKSKGKDKDKDKGKEKSSKHQSHGKSSSHRKGHGGSSSSTVPHAHGSSSAAPQHVPETSYDPSQFAYDPQLQQQYYSVGNYPAQNAAYSTGQGLGYTTTDGQQHLQRGVDNVQNFSYTMGQASTNPSEADYSFSADTYAPEDDGSSTPRNHIAADADEDAFEEMDPRYRIEPSNKFGPGEVFKVYWSEPQGASDGHKHPSVSGKHEAKNKFGSKFYVGFRRFIVVANDLGHATCVPILTYGSRGCKKPGIKASKHGIVYQSGQKIRKIDGEPDLGFAPIQVHIKEDGEKISKESRVNYSKLVTVEHNVRVLFIGSVAHDSWEIVNDAVNQCWDQKVHHRKQKH